MTLKKALAVLVLSVLCGFTLHARYVYTSDGKIEGLNSVKPVLTPGKKETVIASEGLRFRMPDNSFTLPLPVPQTQLDAEGKAVFKIIDLWRFHQLKAYAACRGMEMVIASVASGESPRGERVTLPGYKALHASLKAPAPEDFNAEKYFLDMFNVEVLPDGTELKGAKDCVLKQYTVASDEAKYLALFTVAETRAPFRIYAVAIHVANAHDIPSETAALAASVTPGLPFKRAGTAVKVSEPGADLTSASLYLSAESIAYMPDWRLIQAGEGVLMTNSSSKHIQSMADEMAKNLKMLNALFIPCRPLTAARTMVFASRAEYLANAGAQNERHSMICRGRGEGIILSSPPDFFKPDKNYAQLYNSLRNEMWRQHVSRSLPDAPVWFVEGTSSLMSGLAYKGRGFTLETPEIDNIVANALKSSYRDVRKVIPVTYRKYWAGEDSSNKQRPRLREGVKGLALFLYKGAPVMKKFDYAAVPFKYYRVLSQTFDAAYAEKMAWSGIDMEQFNKDYTTFLESKSLISKAKNYDISSGLTAIYSTIPEKFERPQKDETKKK